MDFDNIFNKVSSLCARQEYCRFDIAEKLHSWNVDSSIAEKVLSQLVAERYIDDERFAGFYARDKFKFNRWGKQKIAWQLRQKQIADEHIQSAIETIVHDDYIKTLDQLLRAKAKSTGKKETFQQRAALIRYAVSRGFEMNIVMFCTARICSDGDD